MEILLIFVVLPTLVGLCIAIYEWRKNTNLLKYDLKGNPRPEPLRKSSYWSIGLRSRRRKKRPKE